MSVHCAEEEGKKLKRYFYLVPRLHSFFAYHHLLLRMVVVQKREEWRRQTVKAEKKNFRINCRRRENSVICAFLNELVLLGTTSCMSVVVVVHSQQPAVDRSCGLSIKNFFQVETIAIANAQSGSLSFLCVKRLFLNCGGGDCCLRIN